MNNVSDAHWVPESWFSEADIQVAVANRDTP
jgi:hypothetical protein